MKDLVLSKDVMSSSELMVMLDFESKGAINKAIKLMFAGEIDDSIVESLIDSRVTFMNNLPLLRA